MTILFLTLDEVLEIHRQQIEFYGGSPGLRDRAALLSALAPPESTFDGCYLHPNVPAMAAADLFHLCQNHPFVDGNKRVGANAAITFLLLNHWEPDFTPSHLTRLVVRLASGRLDKPGLVAIFEDHCHPSRD